eukprot:scaffold1290_cov112-Skeletonema_dohrnii-CCMP3373.AAC.9
MGGLGFGNASDEHGSDVKETHNVSLRDCLGSTSSCKKVLKGAKAGVRSQFVRPALLLIPDNRWCTLHQAGTSITGKFRQTDRVLLKSQACQNNIKAILAAVSVGAVMHAKG